MAGAIWLAGVVAIGALSPGPNNLLVMDSAARRGMGGTLPAIAGVVAGTLLQLAILALGLHTADAGAQAAYWLLAAGSAWLIWLGVKLIGQALFATDAEQSGAPRAGWLRTSMLQFINPKTWAMVVVAAAALQRGELGVAAALAIFILIPATSLLLWAMLGRGVSALLARARNQRWFDGAMGAALLVLAWQLISQH